MDHRRPKHPAQVCHARATAPFGRRKAEEGTHDFAGTGQANVRHIGQQGG
ncbi:hypothetical protein P376_4458 [Streptomyces sp. HCCB10043]|nr:hypothetical protein P376_4458 [Streptomyces sp. HCCB10043]EWS96009.1 hypothetical protein SSIG_07926 [Streptomyces filamentosus NRRL 11379]